MSANPKQQTPDEIAAQIVNARDLFRRARRFDIFHGFEGPLLSTAENFTYIVERQRGRIRDLEQERDEFGESARAYHAALELMFKRAESAEQTNKELLEALRIAESGMSETREIERDFDLDARLSAVETMVHARDYLMQTRSERGLVTSLQSLELIRDGIKNALDGRATGREWRTVRHGYKIERDGPNVPGVSDEDCRCQQCGAVNPPALTHCINHRPPRAALSKHGGTTQGE